MKIGQQTIRSLVGVCLILSGCIARAVQPSLSCVVLHTSGVASVQEEGNSPGAVRVGTIIREKDLLRTEVGTIEVQMGNGAVLRVCEMSSVRFGKLREAQPIE